MRNLSLFLLSCMTVAAILVEPAGAVDSANVEDYATEVVNLKIDPTDPTGKLIRSGRYDKALSVMANGNAVQENEILAKSIVCLYLLERYQEIIDLCKRRLALHNRRSTAGYLYELVGVCNHKLGNQRDALKAFDMAIEAAPTKSAYAGRGLVYSALNKTELADKDFRQAQPSGNFFPPVTAGTAFTQFDNYILVMQRTVGLPAVEVEDESNRSSRSNSNRKQASALRESGEQLEVTGQFKEAANRYKQAIAIRDDDATLWNALGLCNLTDLYQSSGKANLAEVVSQFKKACSLSSTDWRYRHNLAIAEYSAENFDEAAKIMRSSLHMLPAKRRSNANHLIGICESVKRFSKHLDENGN